METYRITGHIFEKESGLGIPDLRVRAYDKDLIFDDLLGAAITDELGKFEMLYSSKDFKEIFEKKPDIYLSVYLPPLQFLTGTKKAVRREGCGSNLMYIHRPFLSICSQNCRHRPSVQISPRSNRVCCAA